jgi:hypothetical protein
VVACSVFTVTKSVGACALLGYLCGCLAVGLPYSRARAKAGQGRVVRWTALCRAQQCCVASGSLATTDINLAAFAQQRQHWLRLRSSIGITPQRLCFDGVTGLLRLVCSVFVRCELSFHWDVHCYAKGGAMQHVCMLFHTHVPLLGGDSAVTFVGASVRCLPVALGVAESCA